MSGTAQLTRARAAALRTRPAPRPGRAPGAENDAISITDDVSAPLLLPESSPFTSFQPARLPGHCFFPVANPQLVARVRFVLRENGQMAENAWREACSARGDTSFDPARHDPEFLASFIEQIGRLAAQASSLVEQVKDLKRRSPTANAAWHRFCQGKSDVDPKKFEASFLQQFIDYCRRCLQKDADSQACQEANADTIQRVHHLQRITHDAKARWRTHCINSGKNSFDPKAHSEDFIQKYLQLMEAAGVKLPSQELVRRIKTLQAKDGTALQAWNEFCDDRGEGRYDPETHQDSFLESFLDNQAMLGRIVDDEDVKRFLESQVQVRVQVREPAERTDSAGREWSEEDVEKMLQNQTARVEKRDRHWNEEEIERLLESGKTRPAWESEKTAIRSCDLVKQIATTTPVVSPLHSQAYGRPIAHPHGRKRMLEPSFY